MTGPLLSNPDGMSFMFSHMSAFLAKNQMRGREVTGRYNEKVRGQEINGEIVGRRT